MEMDDVGADGRHLRADAGETPQTRSRTQLPVSQVVECDVVGIVESLELTGEIMNLIPGVRERADLLVPDPGVSGNMDRRDDGDAEDRSGGPGRLCAVIGIVILIPPHG